MIDTFALQPHPLSPQDQQARGDLRRRTRTQALAIARWAGRHGVGPAEVAAAIGIAPQTMRDWARLRARGALDQTPRGCPACIPAPYLRLEVEEVLQECHGLIGLPSLKVLFPELPRTTLEAYRTQYIHAHDGSTELLTWTTPGIIWAADYTDVACPVDGLYRHILCVRDLASSFQLLCWPVEHADTDHSILALQYLFAAFGPPLVLKTDNGGHLIAQTILGVLEAHGVAHLPSPPLTPWYNGAIEASNGAIKTRMLHLAAPLGRAGFFTCDDVEAARLAANRDGRPQGPNGPSPDQLWQSRPPITADLRQRFLDRLAQAKIEEARNLLDPDAQLPPGLSPVASLGASQRAIVARRATRRTLTEFGFLLARRVAN
jgi:transposase-like protein